MSCFILLMSPYRSSNTFIVLVYSKFYELKLTMIQLIRHHKLIIIYSTYVYYTLSV